MKILMINKNDIEGGAAKAAYRLHKALVDEGLESFMLVANKKSSDPRVIELAGNKWQKGINFLKIIFDRLPTVFYFNRTKTPFYQAKFGINSIIKKINEINPDIVHLHWICGGMMRIEDLVKIRQPVVWTLHDNWAFTGGCHIMWDCKKYKERCGACPRLGSHKENDLSRKIFLRKEKIFSLKKDIFVIGLSRWIYECSKDSTLLKEKKHFLLPNLLDTNFFRPLEKQKMRDKWGFPKNKKLVLFGAYKATQDANKGFRKLCEALQKMENKNIELIIFGSGQIRNISKLNFKVNYVGKLLDENSLVTLYNAVDVVVVPSLQENLSNTIMESLACGIPVVAFDVGGNRDMIEHKINGYLAKPFDTGDLAYGLDWVSNNPDYQKICRNAREKILKEFDSEIIVRKYIEMYKEVANSSSRSSEKHKVI